MNEQERDARRKKADALRYKKALCVDINLESIYTVLEEIESSAGDVQWAARDDDILMAVFDDDQDAAFEFKIAFSDLANDAERMLEDMGNWYVPDCFDTFFAGIGGDGMSGMMGWDSFEQDYFGLGSYQTDIAIKEAGKKLERMTKAQIIEAAGQCFRIAMQFVGLRSRYEDLQAALDIIKAKNNGLLERLTEIDELYDAMEHERSRGSRWAGEQEKKFNQMCEALPEEIWLR